VDNYFDWLTKYGAAFVTNFLVDEDSLEPDKVCLTKSVAIDPSRTTWHAMILVGVQEDTSGQGWFLLQNW
jgi:hypothetical protein